MSTRTVLFDDVNGGEITSGVYWEIIMFDSDIEEYLDTQHCITENLSEFMDTKIPFSITRIDLTRKEI